jgi:hypothetical protein
LAATFARESVRMSDRLSVGIFIFTRVRQCRVLKRAHRPSWPVHSTLASRCRNGPVTQISSSAQSSEASHAV